MIWNMVRSARFRKSAAAGGGESKRRGGRRRRGRRRARQSCCSRVCIAPRFLVNVVTTLILSLDTSDTVELWSVLRKDGHLVFCAKSGIFTWVTPCGFIHFSRLWALGKQNKNSELSFFLMTSAGGLCPGFLYPFPTEKLRLMFLAVYPKMNKQNPVTTSPLLSLSFAISRLSTFFKVGINSSPIFCLLLLFFF